MDKVFWPPPNPAAEALVAAFLDVAVPGWKVRGWQDVSGDEMARLLWPSDFRLQGRGEPRVDPRAEVDLDRALKALADGRPFDIGGLPRGRRMCSRHG